jgi:hypothetical protein
MKNRLKQLWVLILVLITLTLILVFLVSTGLRA